MEKYGISSEKKIESAIHIPIQSTKHKWSPKTYTQSVAMVQNLIVPYPVYDQTSERGTSSMA